MSFLLPLAAPELALYLAGVLVAAFVAGFAGFAFGIVAAGIWLHAIAPAQIVALIAGYALLFQGHAVWKLRRAVRPGRLAPLVLGSALGIPAGIIILQWATPPALRGFVAWLLVLFGLYSLAAPKLPEFSRAGAPQDGAIGVLNGVLAGATGLGGTLPAIWCGMRGWPKDEQRAVFQPTALATFLMAALWLGGAGAVTTDTAALFAIGLPVLACGTWLGWKLYGRIDETAFRKAVYVLLVLSGTLLLSTQST